MAGATTTAAAKRSKFPPEVVIAAGCLIGMITFGPRSAIGQFQLPILGDFQLGSDVFSFAMALQYLFWGLGQPFAGALADRFGTGRVLSVGAVIYAAGLTLMAWASTPTSFTLTAGVLLGFGISACSFNLVIGAFGKLLPAHRRSMAFGLGTAAGSFGQFLFSPFAGGMIAAFGWMTTVFVFSAVILLCIPLSMALAMRDDGQSAPQPGDAPKQSFRQAISEAFQHRSYVLLVAGFFTCGSAAIRARRALPAARRGDPALLARAEGHGHHRALRHRDGPGLARHGAAHQRRHRAAVRHRRPRRRCSAS